MTRALAVGAAVAVAAVALGGCTSSGGTPAASTPAASVTPPSSAVNSPSAPPSSSSSSAPKSGSPSAPTSIRALQPLSCATLPSALGHFHRGGSLPSGVPVPQAVPAFTCTGTGGRIAVSWTTVSAPQYAQELTGTGWARTGATYRKPHAPRTIELLTVRHALVAVYRPS